MKTTKKRLTFQITALFMFLFTPGFLYATPAPPAEKNDIITAKVIDTMNSGGYTYMQVDNSGKQEWVAIPESEIEKGQEVRFYRGMLMKDFTSKTLNRTFATVIFSPGLVESDAKSPHSKTFHKTKDSFSAAVKAEKTSASKSKIRTQTSSGGSMAAIVPFEALEIEKIDAPNGYTVGEIFQRAKELDGKKIAVRGKVVKFSPMIMGKNWVHLQDGTGNAMKNEHDLVITTQDQVQEGDIVVVQGVLAAKKDFGAGYSYEAIIETATLTKE